MTFATLNGNRVIRGTVSLPGRGAWVAEVALDAAPSPIAGAVDLVIGDLTLRGTVAPASSGSFVEQGWYRVIGGAGGWSRILPARAYHNDAGIDVAQVLGDAASEAGETLAELPEDVAAARVEGVDYVRDEGPASRVLGLVLDAGLGWWVDLEGVTRVGLRPLVEIDPGAQWDLLDYHPNSRVANIATETPGAIAIGATIRSARLAAPLTVRALDIDLGEVLRVRAWVDEAGALGPDDGRLARAARATVRTMLPELPYLRLCRYRVVELVSGRASLQAVNSKLGMPDQTFVRLAPGVSGWTQVLTPGTVVVVAFLEGDPSLPMIVAYSPPGEPGFQPVSITGDCTGVMHLGPNSTRVNIAGGDVVVPAGNEDGRVVRYGDKVRINVTAGEAVGTIQLRNPGVDPVAKVRA
jgi:hypothetical protein